MTRRADQDCLGVDDDDSGCDYDSPAHSPVDFTDVPPGHVYHYEESNMSYDSGFSTGSGEVNHLSRLSHSQSLSLSSSTTATIATTTTAATTTTTTTTITTATRSGCHSGIATRSSTMNCHKYPAAIDLDVNAIEGDLGF
jgi:hypothetical protein